jgi:phenylalanyl-tRNA synthetase alpha chain
LEFSVNANDIIALKDTALAEAAAAADTSALEAVRVKYLGRKGLLPEVMKGLKDADPAERPRIGQQANALKQELQAALEEKQAALRAGSAAGADAAFDYTLPGQWPRPGTRHPISMIIERTANIFRTMGFTVAEGPDVETPFYNFDALNTPAEHPSRDPKDTFYLDDGHLLRTHTSPVQVRFMEQHTPPVRIVAPGRAYRRDTPDATHSATFHQIEGLYVDQHVSLADLKGDLAYFARQLMGPDVKVRLRPHFFPFTEPSVEVDFSCHMCHGTGTPCRVCKSSGWIEIAGAGLVDPEVFKAVGYDPEVYTGYAFGMGIERIAMILYGIQDIRMLYENDLRFLEQF